MPYATDRDRNPTNQELEQVEQPAAPTNLFLTSGYMPGVYDLTWDSPADLSLNSRFHVCGVNIYRSFDSEFGPYERITDFPIGTIFWRDQTDNVVVTEVVEDDQWVIRGRCSTGMARERYVFHTRMRPITQAGSQGVPARSAGDVRVFVDGVEVALTSVNGESGQIEIDYKSYYNVAQQNLDHPPDIDDTTTVTVTYRYSRSLLKTNLDTRVFYRVTTVGIPVTLPLDKVQPTDLVETPLERAAFTSNKEIEKIDWIWREAVRRNRWVLSQGGERVKVFLRKTVGQPCPCIDLFDATHKQDGRADCPYCYGTGVLGGYEGPYDLVVAPPETERRIAQRDIGRVLEMTYEGWTGPSPLLSMRDFLVKINGERFSIGAVRMPTNRGMVLQQHFNIAIIPENDIRYSVPLDNPQGLVVTQTGPVVPPQHLPPMVTDKPNIPNERELRGRTATWENIVYAFPFFLLYRDLVDAAVSWFL